MSQPTQPTQPFQPPPQPQPQFVPIAPQGKRKRFGWIALLITGLVALFLGIGMGAAGDGRGSTAAPAPTVTVTETADPPPVVEGGQDEPTEEPTQEPATFKPKKSDFVVTLKITGKQCFGSAGCNVSFEPQLAYRKTAPRLPKQGVTSVTFEVTGSQDSYIGTLEVDGSGKVTGVDEQDVETRSSSSKLTAKVTEVEYNEFG